ncbi:MFS transporter [Balneolaceae bacterium ANBcel3]|nr:MFS transporter [Balneolaceae bacterium ANBcel3]
MRKGSLSTVFLVVLIDLIGFGLVLPLLPFYASEFGASALVIGLLYSSYSVAQLVFSPFWGSLSDRLGRRPVMLFSTAGAMLAYLMFGFATSLFVLFLSRLVAGVMGGNIAAAQAYIADSTSEKDRAKGMGLIGAAFGIGFVLGPALASGIIHPGFHEWVGTVGFERISEWMQLYRFGLPGFFAAFLSACSFAMVAFFLPETVDLNKAKTDTDKARSSIFMPSFWKKLAQHKKTGSAGLLLLLFSVFLLSFGQSSLYSAFPLFAESILGMAPEQVGMQFFYIGLIAVVVQGGLIRPLSRWFSEQSLFLTGNILMTLGLGAIALSGTVSMLTVFLGVMALGHSLNLPTINSLISKESDTDRFGAMMGLSQGLSGLGRALGPAWGGLLFGISAYLPFIATALVLCSTIYIGWRIMTVSRR